MQNRLLLLLTLLLSTQAHAADAEIHGSYFAVIVTDVEVSTDWYQSVFELDAGPMLSSEGRYRIVNLHGPGLFVELLQLAAAAPRPEGMLQGPFKVGMLVDDLDAFVDSLPDRVPRPELIEDAGNQLVLVQLRDPDGYIVQVMQLLDSGGDGQAGAAR